MVAHLNNQAREQLKSRRYGLRRKRGIWARLVMQTHRCVYQADSANGGSIVTTEARIIRTESRTIFDVRFASCFGFGYTIPPLPDEYARTARKGRRE